MFAIPFIAYFFFVLKLIEIEILRFVIVQSIGGFIICRITDRWQKIQIASVIGGYILEFIGHHKNQYQIQWLGHYLAGSGKNMKLSAAHMADIYETTDFDNAYRFDKHQQWNTLDGLWVNALGKVRFNIVGAMIAIVDYYKFYAMSDARKAWYAQNEEDSNFSEMNFDFSYDCIDLFFGDAHSPLYRHIKEMIIRMIFSAAVKSHTFATPDKYNGREIQFHFKSSHFDVWKNVSRLLRVIWYMESNSIQLIFSDALFVPYGKSFLTYGKYTLPQVDVLRFYQRKLSHYRRKQEDLIYTLSDICIGLRTPVIESDEFIEIEEDESIAF